MLKPTRIYNPYRYLFYVAMVVMVIILILNLGFFVGFLDKILIIFHRPVNSATTRISQLKNSILYYEQIIQENTSLKEQNVSLLQQNNELKAFREENEQLKQLLNYQKNNNDQKKVLAEIYAQDPLNVSDILIIDKGQNQGIKTGQHVVYNGIYIGQIVSSDEVSSKLRLVTSPNQVVIGQIADTQATGIVKGQIGFGLIMQDIPPDTAMQPGQVVTTAQIDPDTPANLLIGEVTEIYHLDQNIFQQAALKPFFERKDLHFVYVLIND